MLKMRAVITLLVLLLSMCGSLTLSTQTDLHTESQSTGAAAAAAAAEVSTQLDVSAELRELRDMVGELRVTLSFTRDELQNTKYLLNKIEAENKEQDTEVTAVKTRLASSETEVVNLRKEAAAQTADLRSVTERVAVTETDMEHVQKDTAAQHTDLTTMNTEVMNLKMELSASETEVEKLKMQQVAQEAELVVLKTRINTDEAQEETRLSTSETEVEKLKMEQAAQDSELTAVKTRLAATETEVVNLEKEITEKPKVAFSAALTPGYIQGIADSDLNVVFTKTISNVGQAYSNMTGFFTAPVKGVYYFRFTVMDKLASRWIGIKMAKNGETVMVLFEYENDGLVSFLSSGVTLQLEVGDAVNMRLPAGNRLYEESTNQNTFSGFLLFPL